MSITKEQAVEQSTVAGTPAELFKKFDKKVLEQATLYAKQRSPENMAKYKLALTDLINLSSGCIMQGVLEEKASKVLHCKVDNFQLLNGSVNSMLFGVMSTMSKTPIDPEIPLSTTELAKLLIRPELCMTVEIEPEVKPEVVLEAPESSPKPVVEVTPPMTPEVSPTVPEKLPEPPVTPPVVIPPTTTPTPVIETITLIDDTTMVVDKSTGHVDFKDLEGESVGGGFIPQDSSKSWKDNILDWLSQMWAGIKGVVWSVGLGLLAVGAGIVMGAAGVGASLWKILKSPYTAYKMKDEPKQVTS